MPTPNQLSRKDNHAGVVAQIGPCCIKMQLIGVSLHTISLKIFNFYSLAMFFFFILDARNPLFVFQLPLYLFHSRTLCVLFENSSTIFAPPHPTKNYVHNVVVIFSRRGGDTNRENMPSSSMNVLCGSFWPLCVICSPRRLKMRPLRPNFNLITISGWIGQWSGELNNV